MPTRRQCPKCQAEWEVNGPVGFREECPECAAFIHTCANCVHYEASTRGCDIVNTEAVRDRQSVNFCEDFEFNPGAPGSPARASRKPDPKQAADAARRRFENLFRDPNP